jgi:4-diphosphocytidyl-2-C-methyl-D-erythritol kinase
MISFPNAKVNLGLFITEKREDGFHNLESVFLPVELFDILEFTISLDGNDNFQQSGITLNGKDKDNLVIKALHLLREEFSIPGLQIHLHKKIPVGAGLGGGSSDAAFMLMMLNKYFELRLSEFKLMEMASKLGSDCSFFILNEPAIARGRGEILKNINIALEKIKIIIVMPDFNISTAEAFSGIKPQKPSKTISDLIKRDINSWHKDLHNDFEKTIIPKHPEIQKIKEDLLLHGALYTSMSGSGSSVFGLFEKIPDQLKLNKAKIIYSGNLNMNKKYVDHLVKIIYIK